MKVLYIDDEDLNLTLFSMMFRAHFTVITAKSGQDALNILSETEDLNAVITDMNMPLMNGLEFIAKAKLISDEIPYMILTGYSRNADLQRAVDDGVIARCFEKPFNEKLIVSTLHELSRT